MVTGEVDNLLEKGEIKINGLFSSARSVDGEKIPEGEIVSNEKISGNKALVKKIKKVLTNGKKFRMIKISRRTA